MELLYLPTLISYLENKYLLLDANIFRDAALKPTIFAKYFNELKKANVTLVTTHFVKYEMLKGSANTEKYKTRETLINNIIDATLPVTAQTFPLIYNLIESYGIDGSALHITDLLLGAILMQYKKNMCLMTRDTTDFLQPLFSLISVVNLPHHKGIFTYGIYQYVN